MKPNEQNELRETFLNKISDFLVECNEEVLRVASNQVAIPCVSSSGEEAYMVITFKVPSGTRDGEQYDGYAEAEDYAKTVEQKAIKKKKSDEKKKKKIASDTLKRQKAATEKDT